MKEYTINQLSKLAGITSRTLRYYDSIGLLCPARVNDAGYRIYSQVEVDRLQTILFCRELGMSLSDAAECLSSEKKHEVFLRHLETLKERQKNLERLINNVNQTLLSMKGECKMTDEQKFEGLKRERIAKNEAQYGAEARKLFGSDAVDDSNAALMAMDKATLSKTDELERDILLRLKEGMDAHERADGEFMKSIARMHGEWLRLCWGKYSPEAHMGLAKAYVCDERFRKYYDNAAGSGAAQLLCDAITALCTEKA